MQHAQPVTHRGLHAHRSGGGAAHAGRETCVYDREKGINAVLVKFEIKSSLQILGEIKRSEASERTPHDLASPYPQNGRLGKYLRLTER